MPNITYDGDFTVAQLAGPPVYEIPFKADPKPYGYKLPYWQFFESYAEAPFNSPGPLGGFYVGGTPGTFKSVGGGIIEFWREYALLPDSRNEYESFVYSYQIAHWTSDSASITEIPITVQSRIQYDYFRTDNPEGLPVAPRTLTGTVHLVNGDANFTGTDTAFLSELAPHDIIYKGAGNIQGTIDSIINDTAGVLVKPWAGNSFNGTALVVNAGAGDPIFLPKAPRAIQDQNFVYFINGFGSLVDGAEILAEDATYRCWKGNIYERQQRFVVARLFREYVAQGS